MKMKSLAFGIVCMVIGQGHVQDYICCVHVHISIEFEGFVWFIRKLGTFYNFYWSWVEYFFLSQELTTVKFIEHCTYNQDIC